MSCFPLARLLIPALLSGSAVFSSAQIAITPPILEITLGEPAAIRSVRLDNLSARPIEIRATIRNWDLDENNEIRVLPPAEQSLDSWISFAPDRFTIPPKSYQVLRIAIRPKGTPEVGEHRAVLLCEEVAGRDWTSQSGVHVLFRLGVAIYAYVGQLNRESHLNCVDADELGLLFDLSNSGNAHIRLSGQYAVWAANAYPGTGPTPKESAATSTPGLVNIGTLPDVPVLPGSRRKLRSSYSKTLQPGDYVLDVNGTLSTMPLVFHLPFTVPPQE